MQTVREKETRGKNLRAVMPFDRYKEMAMQVRSYETEFRDFLGRELSSARKEMKSKASALRESATPDVRRVWECFELFESTKAVSYLIGEAENLVSKGEFLNAAMLYAMGITKPPAKETAEKAILRSEALKTGLEKLIDSVSLLRGIEAAEEVCRALSCSGLPVVPGNTKEIVLETIEKLEKEGNFGKAFEIAAYWSQDFYAGFECFVSRERLEALFANSKRL